MIVPFLGVVFRILTLPGLVVHGVVEELALSAVVPGVGGESRTGDEELVEHVEAIAEMDDDAEVEAYLADVSDGDGTDGEGAQTVDQYDLAGSYPAMFLVVLAPFFVCTALALVLYLFVVGLLGFGTIPFWIGAWLAFSVGANAFPSMGATDALLAKSRGTDSLLRVVGYPVVAASKVVNLLEVLWLDAVYSLSLYGVVYFGFALLFGQPY